MNPTKELTRKLVEAEQHGKTQKAVAEETKLKLEKLTKEHEELIETSCKLENDLRAIEESLEEFCSQCELKSTQTCRGCTLYAYL